MSLKTSDLYRRHDQLIELKRRTYEKIYEKCIKQIKLISNTGGLFCVYEIPAFIFGSEYPVINIPCCSNYIINKLNKYNPSIATTFIEPNFILIDWRKK